jgi:M6 family metalloprotease-like protein
MMRPCAAAAALVGLAAAAAPPPPLLPAAACRLPNVLPDADVALGFPRVASCMRATGAVTLSVLFVDFSDAPAAASPQDVYAALAPAADWWGNVSRGAMQPALAPLLHTLRMSRPSTAYDTRSFDGQRAYLAEATQLAVASLGADFSGSDSVVVMASTAATALPNGPAFCALPGQGYTASGRTFLNSATSGHDFLTWHYKWLNHEGGHTLALVDLYAYDGGDAFRYTGDWGVMGNIAGAGGEYFGYERFLLGWLDDDAGGGGEVACLPAGSSQLRVAPVEAPGATPAGAARLALVRLDDTVAVAVEVRSQQGFDAGIPKPGVLAYLVNTSAPSGYGPLQVLPLGVPGDRLTATLAPGEALTHAGVTVTCASLAADGTAVVTVDAPCNAFTCPPPGTCGGGGGAGGTCVFT